MKKLACIIIFVFSIHGLGSESEYTALDSSLFHLQKEVQWVLEENSVSNVGEFQTGSLINSIRLVSENRKNSSPVILVPEGERIEGKVTYEVQHPAGDLSCAEMSDDEKLVEELEELTVEVGAKISKVFKKIERRGINARRVRKLRELENQLLEIREVYDQLNFQKHFVPSRAYKFEFDLTGLVGNFDNYDVGLHLEEGSIKNVIWREEFAEDLMPLLEILASGPLERSEEHSSRMGDGHDINNFIKVFSFTLSNYERCQFPTAMNLKFKLSGVVWNGQHYGRSANPACMIIPTCEFQMPMEYEQPVIGLSNFSDMFRGARLLDGALRLEGALKSN